MIIHISKISSLVTIFFVFTFIFKGFSQESVEELKKNANKLFNQENFIDAKPLYLRLLSVEPKNNEYQYKYGTCLLYTSDKKQEAFKYLSLAIKSDDIDPLAYFYLARAYHINYNFNQAVYYYKNFQKLGNKKIIKEKNVDLLIENCNNAKKLINQFNDVIVIDKQKSNKNNFFRNYDLTQIGGTIIKSDVFQSKEDRKKEHIPIIHFPENSKTIYYASYGNNNNQKDIYFRTRLEDGKWSEPKLVPGSINTNEDEDFPFMHPNGEYLYFSSKGHNSIGGYDLFKSKWDEKNGVFLKPENLDFPISSVHDDFLYTIDSLEQYAYFASNRNAEHNMIDVYHILVQKTPTQIAIIKGDFYSELEQKSKSISLEIFDKNNQFINKYTSDNQGNYMMTFPNHGEYTIKVQSELSTQIFEFIVEIPKQDAIIPLKQKFIEYLDNESIKIKIVNDFHNKHDDQDEIIAEIMSQKSEMEVNKNLLISLNNQSNPIKQNNIGFEENLSKIQTLLNNENDDFQEIQNEIQELKQMFNELTPEQVQQIKNVESKLEESQAIAQIKKQNNIEFEENIEKIQALITNENADFQDIQNEIQKLKQMFDNLTPEQVQQIKNVESKLEESQAIAKVEKQKNIEFEENLSKIQTLLNNENADFQDIQNQIQELKQMFNELTPEQIQQIKNVESKLKESQAIAKVEKQKNIEFEENLSKIQTLLTNENADFQDIQNQIQKLKQMFDNLTPEQVQQIKNVESKLEESQSIAKVEKQKNIEFEENLSKIQTLLTNENADFQDIQNQIQELKQMFYELTPEQVQQIKNVESKLEESQSIAQIKKQNNIEFEENIEKIQALLNNENADFQEIQNQIQELKQMFDELNPEQVQQIKNVESKLEKSQAIAQIKKQNNIEFEENIAKIQTLLNNENADFQEIQNQIQELKQMFDELTPEQVQQIKVVESKLEESQSIAKIEKQNNIEFNESINEFLPALPVSSLQKIKNAKAWEEIAILEQEIEKVNSSGNKNKEKRLVTKLEKLENQVFNQILTEKSKQIQSNEDTDIQSLNTALDNEILIAKIKSSGAKQSQKINSILKSSLKDIIELEKIEESKHQNQIKERIIEDFFEGSEIETKELLDNTKIIKLKRKQKDLLTNQALILETLRVQSSKKDKTNIENQITQTKDQIKKISIEIEEMENNILQQEVKKNELLDKKIDPLSIAKPIDYLEEHKITKTEIYKNIYKLSDSLKLLQSKYEKEIAQMLNLKTVFNTQLDLTQENNIEDIKNSIKIKDLSQEIIEKQSEINELEKLIKLKQKKLDSEFNQNIAQKTSIENLLLRDISPNEPATSNLDLDSIKNYNLKFEINNESKVKEQENEFIPISPTEIEGLVYRVQVGAFSKPLKTNVFSEFSPIIGEEARKNLIRYMVGYFTEKEVALEALQKIRALGYSDAFLVAYCNGERILIYQADQLKASGKCGSIKIKQYDQKEILEITREQKVTDLDYAKKSGAAKSETIEQINGLFFTVQIGVYNKPVSASQLYNISPLLTLRLPNGQIRYSTGKFSDLQQANIKKNICRETGINDAFVTAYFNGERITLDEANKLIDKYGKKIFYNFVDSTPTKQPEIEINNIPTINQNYNKNELKKIYISKKSYTSYPVDELNELKKLNLNFYYDFKDQKIKTSLLKYNVDFSKFVDNFETSYYLHGYQVKDTSINDIQEAIDIKQIKTEIKANIHEQNINHTAWNYIHLLNELKEISFGDNKINVKIYSEKHTKSKEIIHQLEENGFTIQSEKQIKISELILK